MRVVGGFCGGGFGFEGVEGFSEGVSDDASCVADGDEFFAVCENGGFKEFGFVFEFEHAELQVEGFFVGCSVEHRVGLEDGGGGVKYGGEVGLGVVIFG